MDNQADGLREAMKEQRRSKRPLRVIGVTSGKGGVGKTNLAANLAILAAKQGQRRTSRSSMGCDRGITSATCSAATSRFKTCSPPGPRG
jgi:Flp pilus assembly CpaE family ATPase